MYTSYQKIKYRVISPFSIKIINSLFTERNANHKKPLATPPFFIIGSGRNGSTLLSAILNNHPNLFIPPEQYVLPYSIMKWHIQRYKPSEKLIAEIVADYSNPKRTNKWKMDFEALKKAVRKKNPKEWTINTLTDLVFRNYGKEHKKNSFIWGERAPITSHFVPLISREFPNAKFIFLVRDPRDMVLSCSKLQFHAAAETSVAIRIWNDSIKSYDWLCTNKSAADVHLIKYENLVTQPEQEIKKILQFLDVSWFSDILNPQGFASSMGVSELSHHQNLSKSINSNSIGKWKTEFTLDEVKNIEKKTHKNMKRFQYS